MENIIKLTLIRQQLDLQEIHMDGQFTMSK